MYTLLRNKGGRCFAQGAVFLLLFSFVLTPLVPVFAQEGDIVPMPQISPTTDSQSSGEILGETTPPTDVVLDTTLPEALPSESTDPNGTVIDDPKTVPEPETPTEEPKEEVAPEEVALMESLSTTEPSSSNLVNSDGKSTTGVDNHTGRFIYEVPLIIPPGRGSMSPGLSLVYDSQEDDMGGIAGFGWNINIPYILRINKNGVDKLYASSTFSSSFSGELATTSSAGVYGAKDESGSFLKYELANNVWAVTDKRGNVYRFGINTSARQDDPFDSNKIYKWMLEEVRDPNNNYIKYEYYKDSRQVYPYKITYTGYATTDGPIEIEFVREPRSDQATSSASAFISVTKERLNLIKAKINGTVVREYDLTYTTSSNNSRSLLSSILETGYDESNIATTTPPTQFVYQTTTPNWSYDSAYTIPYTFSDQIGDLGVRVVDINGDALPDIVKSDSRNGSSTQAVYINDGDGTGWTASSTWAVPEFITRDYLDLGVQFSDVNGDGLVDMARSHLTGTSTVSQTYINTGGGWTATSSYALPTAFTTATSSTATSSDLGVRITEVNGDGLPDIVESRTDGAGTTKHVYLNNGYGWTENTTWTVPEVIIERSIDLGVQFADVNNDGLSDVIRSYKPCTGCSPITNNVYINTGSNWVHEPNWLVPVAFSNGGGDQGLRIVDVNGDNLPDLVKSQDKDNVWNKKVYLNNGIDTWVEDVSWTVPEVITSTFAQRSVQFADVDGDGMQDLLKSEDNGGGSETKKTYINNGRLVDMVQRVTSSKGGFSDVRYQTTPLYTSGGSLLNNTLPFVLNTVQSFANNDALGNGATTTYSYTNGEWYFNNPLDRKFAGFGKIVETNPAGYVTQTYYHQGNTSDSTRGEYNDHSSKIGQPYRTETYDGSSNVYAKSIHQWDRYALTDTRSFVKFTRTITFAYDGDSDHRDTATEYTYNNSTGDVTEQILWGEVTGSDDGSFTDTGTDKFTTSYTYAASSTNPTMSLLDDETTLNQSNTKIKQSRYYYDSESLGVATKGNLTKQEFWKSLSTYVDVERTYDSYGLVATEKDPRDKTTSFSYDPYHFFVSTTTNPLSQKIVYSYDYSAGKPKQVTDVNGRIFQTIFDGLDRISEEKQPDLTTPTTLVTKVVYVYSDIGVPTRVKRTNYLTSTNSVDSYQYFDGLGRVVQDRTESEDAFTVKDYVYNSLGLVQKETLPYAGSGAGNTTPTSTTALYVSYLYDPLQRVTAVHNILGTTTSAYNNWKTTVIDAESNTKDLIKDSYNNLSTVVEYNNSAQATTTYEYNGLGNLTKITDALGNIRNFTYDGLGRRTLAEDLHTTADSQYGLWSFTYDDAGNITSTVDPKSQTIEYSYDDINRVLTENYTGAGGTEVSYSYDGCTDGVGRLCIATSSGATASYVYNPLGLIKTENKTINATLYSTQYDYDRQGNTTLITYPDNQEAKYEYNTAGQLEKVSTRPGGGSFSYVVSDYDYTPTGKPSFKAFGNYATSTYTYDPSALYRLVNMLTVVPSTGGESLMGESALEQEKASNTENNAIDSTDSASTIQINDTSASVIKISSLLASKTSAERATIKGREIALRVKGNQQLERENYTIELVVLNAIEGGIEVFARAWDAKGKQVGFGKDGSVDIERFRIFNPPILVPDGTYYPEEIEKPGGGTKTIQSPNFMEDPQEALLQSLEHTISLVAKSDKKIIAGKVGNTTDTYYPDANPESSSVDGFVEYESSQLTWSNIRTANGTGSGDTDVTRYILSAVTSASSGYFVGLRRGLIIFDTSALGDTDTIDSATLSFIATARGDHDPTYEHFSTITGATTASATALASSDYQSQPSHSTKFATSKSIKNDIDIGGSTYTNWTLNSSGRSNVNTTGASKFALKFDEDTDNSTFSWVANTNFGLAIRLAETSGTTQDPKLVVEHSAYIPPIELVAIQNISYSYDAVGNITQIADHSHTGVAKTVVFGYDDLYRLTSASTTAASSTPFRETYTYNEIGNITNKSDLGTYTYSGTGYTNPHAVTSIGGTSYVYDTNGNMTDIGTSIDLTWDYLNRPTQWSNGTATSTYSYDHTTERVKKTTAGVSTIFPNDYYMVEGGRLRPSTHTVGLTS